MTDLFNLGQIFPRVKPRLHSTCVNELNEGATELYLYPISLVLHVEKISALPSVNISLFVISVLKIRSTFAVNLTAVVNLVTLKCVAISADITKSFNQNTICRDVASGMSSQTSVLKYVHMNIETVFLAVIIPPVHTGL